MLCHISCPCVRAMLSCVLPPLRIGQTKNSVSVMVKVAPELRHHHIGRDIVFHLPNSCFGPWYLSSRGDQREKRTEINPPQPPIKKKKPEPGQQPKLEHVMIKTKKNIPKQSISKTEPSKSVVGRKTEAVTALTVMWPASHPNQASFTNSRRLVFPPETIDSNCSAAVNLELKMLNELSHSLRIHCSVVFQLSPTRRVSQQKQNKKKYQSHIEKNQEILEQRAGT